MKRIIYILTVLFVAGCVEMKDANPYEGGLHVLTVAAQWPGDEPVQAEVEVLVEDMNTGSRYSSFMNIGGVAVFNLPNGLYRVNLSGRNGSDVFNAAADKVVLSGADMRLDLRVSVSKAGSIVIKEIYCGGCKKLPLEGNYQADQYFILHNNHFEIQYLDSLCFGTLSPYNSSGSNPWGTMPDFLPIIQAVWQFPGDGDDFPLQPGEDAVVCMKGAIDHAAQYPLSVNLNKPEYFVCYNQTYFPNTTYHPVPGDLISADRYLEVVIKTGKANAYTWSISSPTLVLFKAKDVDIRDFVIVPENVTPVPGSSSDNVVKVPFEWVLDAVEVFDGGSVSNQKRIDSSLDAGYVLQTDTFLGRSLMRKVDQGASTSAGYEVLVDTNNSLNDFYETEKQSLHE